MQTKAIMHIWSKSDNNLICIGSNRIEYDKYSGKVKTYTECEIYEYNGLSVEFESNDPKDFLEIDSSVSDNPIKIKPGEKAWLTNYGATDLMFTPYQYIYSIICSGKFYEGMFFIKPASIEWDNLINLTNSLENIFRGLSKNLYVQRMHGKEDVITESDTPLIEIYNYIDKNKNIIINAINSILQNPITNIKREYKEQFNSTKLDIKSERWLFKKGYNKNQNWYRPEITLGKHSILSSNCIENMYIKNILIKTIDIIEILEDKYGQVYEQIIKKQDNKRFLLNKKEQKLNGVLNKDYRIGKRYKTETKNQIISFSDEISKLNKKRDFFKNILENLTKIKAIFIYFIHETWMKELTNYYKANKISYGILKDRRYFQIYSFYKELLSIESNRNQLSQLNFSNKPTYRLFEYYSVIMSIECLMDLGFIWEKGWLADTNEIYTLNGEIPVDEPMTFTNANQNLKVILYYDKKIQIDDDILNSGKSDFGRGMSPHYNPDIIVSFFDLKTELFLKAFIIEVKCRKSKNLVSQNGPSEVMEQINSYLYLNFYDFNEEKEDDICKIGKIDRVVVLYPKQDNPVPIKKIKNKIKFIQIEALESVDIKEHYGYNDLKNEFIQVINKVKKE